jgi:hypothetical protein
MSLIGVEMPKDDNGNVVIGQIEEEDVLGLPVIGILGLTFSKDKSKAYTNIVTMMKWEDGERLSPDEFTENTPF